METTTEKQTSHPVRNASVAVVVTRDARGGAGAAGFLAAWNSKSAARPPSFFSWNGATDWAWDIGLWKNYPANERVQFCLLLPSGCLMHHSLAARMFSNGEYSLAGGGDTLFVNKY